MLGFGADALRQSVDALTLGEHCKQRCQPPKCKRHVQAGALAWQDLENWRRFSWEVERTGA